MFRRRTRTTAVLLTAAVTVPIMFAASSGAVATTATLSIDERAEGASVHLVPRGGYATNAELGAEIATYDPLSRRIFVTNGATERVDVLDARNLDRINRVGTIEIDAYGADLQSVAVSNGRLAVAIAADPVTDPGVVAVFDTRTLREIAVVPVGALPDAVTWTPDGRHLLVANEAEPRCVDTNDPTEAIDPEGSVTIIEFAGRSGVKSVRTATFAHLNDRRAELIAAGVRLNWPGATVAEELEPEYITTDGRTAWVSLQENNTIAVVDIRSATVTDLLPLGRKDHSLPGNGLDASDRDGGNNNPLINIQNWPVLGIPMPDSIASMSFRGGTYLLGANEGDGREWFVNDDEGQGICFADVRRVSTLTQADVDIPDFPFLRNNARLGRLNVSVTDGIDPATGKYTSLHALGTRSMTIWDAAGQLVWDSGDMIEQITASIQRRLVDEESPIRPFNTNRTGSATWDSRSDDKGPEPEGIAVGTAWGRTYAFVGLERQHGIVVFDVTNPHAPSFVQLIATTGYTGLFDGDTSPEGLEFVPAGISGGPNPLLIVAYEGSGSTRVFELRRG
jgi:DNA-binding beta-propeller fold protein YncE